MSYHNLCFSNHNDSKNAWQSNLINILCEMQLEITCRGQRLQPTMTLQQVRDTIWRPVPAEAAAVLPAPGSPSTNQIMTLHYGRS